MPFKALRYFVHFIFQGSHVWPDAGEDPFYQRCMQAFRTTTVDTSEYKDCIEVVQSEVDSFFALESVRC